MARLPQRQGRWGNARRLDGDLAEGIFDVGVTRETGMLCDIASDVVAKLEEVGGDIGVA